MENKIFCVNCGAELEVGAAFCMNCGTAQVAPVAASEAPAEASAQPIPGAAPVQPGPSFNAIQQYNMNVKPKKKIGDIIDIKRTVLNNIVPVACLVIGIVLIFVGLGVRTPSSYISSYAMTEYVGGDAYNFIIEACMRGGRIGGAVAAKAVYICAGFVVACMSALKINVIKPEKEKNKESEAA